ncbi:FHA domain-containing protein [Mycobacterium sp.]|uniref:FHA domain-containing protein n=1 Tax=Mycobacterium sp. TaxID=1785 RepID=UPI0031D203E5
MTDFEATAVPELLIVHTGDRSHAIERGHGVVTIGSSPHDGVPVDDPRVSLKVDSADGQWHVVDGSAHGMFLDGHRMGSVTVTDRTTVLLGDPTTGKPLTFEVVHPSTSTDQPRSSEPSDYDVTGTWHTEDLDPGVVRAGAAAAARRRELDISQRSLAADGVINAGALIAFEKGRSWPRERTRAKLEEVLRWPPGTIARIRAGGPTPGEEVTEILSVDDQVPLIAQAVIAAVDGCNLASAALPPVDDPGFTRGVAPILADLRRLEAVAVRATQIGRVTQALIKALTAVRRQYDELMTRGAQAPGATLGQRLYAARRRANLSISEIAHAAGVAEEVVVGAEADDVVPAAAAAAIEALISQLG